jgi:NCAIR mutase (PurE)-related protein
MRLIVKIIYCAGKTVEQVAAIFKAMSEENNIGTRADQKMFEAVKKVYT